MPKVSLNSVDYVVRGKIQRRTQTPFAEVFRTIGLQRREDIQTATGFVFGPPIYGFGRRRITKIDDPKQILQFWDSRLETRFPTAVYLPLLAQQSTDLALSVLRASVSFNGNLWGLWERNDADPNSSIHARRYIGSTTTWGGGGQVESVGIKDIARDLISYQTGMIALVHGTSPRPYHSTDGITWTLNAFGVGAGTLANQPTANEDLDAGLLAVVGNEKVLINYDETNGQIQFASGTTLSGGFTDEAIPIPSGNGPQGVAVYQGIDGVMKLLLGTREALWEIDAAPATWTRQKILEVPAHNDNFRRMTVHQGKLWFSLGVDNNSPAPIWTMEVRGDARIFDSTQGLDQDDGVPAELLGPVRWMKSAGKYLFASVGGGAASRNGRVIAHNGLGWHSMYRNGTANQQVQWIDVSADDDGIPRLHFALRTVTTTSDTQFLRDPMTNPAAGASVPRESSALIDHPEFDGGMPRYNAAWLEVFGDAVNLGDANGEYIAIASGLNGATPSTSLGNIVDGDLDLLFGTGGIGVSARSIQIRETFNRDAGVNTDTPTWRSMELTYLKKPPKLEAWAFLVDLKATAALILGDVEQVITNLATARDSVPLVPFVYGKMTSANVKVEEPLIYDEVLDEEGVIGASEREGTVQVIVREVV